MTSQYKSRIARLIRHSSILLDPFSSLHHQCVDDRVPVLAHLDAAVRPGSFDERVRIVKPDGEIRWVWMRGFPRRDANGKITRPGRNRTGYHCAQEGGRPSRGQSRQGELGLGGSGGPAQGHSCLPKTFTWIVFSMHCSDSWQSWFPIDAPACWFQKEVRTGWP
jgi:hypothetical protein